MKRLQKIAMMFIFFGVVTSLAWAKPHGVVMGYSAMWFDGIYPIESYNFSPFTYIVRAFLIPQADGSINVPDGFFDPELEKLAHAHGVQLLISIGGESAGSSNWLSLARHPKSEKRFFDTLEKLATDYHYDGVDIDWEPSALTDPDQATFAQFMQDLRHRFPTWIITAALGGGDYWAKHVSWDKVSASVNYINLMAYDFSGGWTGHSGHNANLYEPSNPKVDTTLSVNEMVNRLENKYGVPAGKIVLGLPFYGTEFFTKHMGDAFVGTANNGETEMEYYELQNFIQAPHFKAFWDAGAQAPYLERQDQDLVVSYDDPKSIRLKCEFAQEHQLGGVMIWNLGADVTGEKTPLLDAVAQAFGAPVQSMPASGLTKTIQFFASSVNGAYTKLQAAYNKLENAGNQKAAAAVDPGAAPDVTIPDSLDAHVLGQKSLELADLLATYDLKLSDAQAAINAIPVPVVVGTVLKAPRGKNKLLIDNFEKDLSENLLSGQWATACDQNNLGTTIHPMPFKPSAGGYKGSQFAAHIWGHFGKSQAPWPFAVLTATLSSDGSAVDLSGFKAIEFWVKGDGQSYSFSIARAAVQDYCNFRKEFIATRHWSKVVIPLKDLTQPAWGKQVPFKLNDVLYMGFAPGANFSDQNYDLWLDNVALIK